MKTLLTSLIILFPLSVSPVFGKVEDFIGKIYLCSFETYSINHSTQNRMLKALDESPFGFTVTEDKIKFSKNGFFNGDEINVIDKNYKFNDMLMGSSGSYSFKLLDSIGLNAHVLKITTIGASYSFVAECEEL